MSKLRKIQIIYHYIYCKIHTIKPKQKQQNKMAFVIDKAQKKSIFQPTQQITFEPGPGSYNALAHSNIHLNQYCAPFNASQVKVSYFDVPETKSGPGSYQPKYYKDLLSDVKYQKGYVFQSKVQRFSKENRDKNNQRRQKNKSEIKKAQNQGFQTFYANNTKSQLNRHTNYSLSPSYKTRLNKQSYNQKLQKSKSLINEIRQQNHQNKVQSIKGKKQFIRVILTSSTNTQNIQSRYIYRNIKGKTLGPGCYQDIQFKPKSKSVAKWNLSKEQRFKTQPSLVPGPGAYKPQRQNYQYETMSENGEGLAHNKNTKLSAAFASSVIRSHMDTVIYRTNIPIKAAILEDRRIKDSRPGPGTYNTSSAYKNKMSFNYGGQNNLGCAERNFLDMSSSDVQPGPGFYQMNSKSINIRGKTNCSQIIKEMRTQIFGKRGKISSNYNKNNSLNRSYSQKRTQNYDIADHSLLGNLPQQKTQKKLVKFCSLEERCFSRLGTMNQQQRFKKKVNNLKESVPGPGDYYNQNIQSDFGPHLAQKGNSSVFRSGTDRNVFQSSQKNTNNEIPYYNIIRNDIGFKAQKMRRYIENLKRINIIKTPFQTSSKRFIEEPVNLNVVMPQAQQTKQKLQQFSNAEKPKQPSSIFKSGTKRQVFTNQINPGPGQYQIKMKSNGTYQAIEKKSFNKNYGHMRIEENNNSSTKNVGGGFNTLSRKPSKKQPNKNQTTNEMKNKSNNKSDKKIQVAKQNNKQMSS